MSAIERVIDCASEVDVVTDAEEVAARAELAALRSRVAALEGEKAALLCAKTVVMNVPPMPESEVLDILKRTIEGRNVDVALLEQRSYALHREVDDQRERIAALERKVEAADLMAVAIDATHGHNLDGDEAECAICTAWRTYRRVR